MINIISKQPIIHNKNFLTILNSSIYLNIITALIEHS